MTAKLEWEWTAGARGDAAAQRRHPLKRLLRVAAIAVAVIVVGILLIQAIPYGRAHSNPAGDVEPAWDSPRTRSLAVAACFDCHSNVTTWPWYSNIAPVSWLVQRDVDSGRRRLNFSEWDRPQRTGRIAERVQNGSMPPLQYKILHSRSRLSSAEEADLIAGLEATFGTSGGGRSSPTPAAATTPAAAATP